MRAFLSHSSKDKEGYVKNVARWLGKDNIIYDEFTFEEGEKPLDEILKGLDKTEIFVIFLSESALESPWVKREIIEAKLRLDELEIKKVFPIIIQEDLTYEDKRIPLWLRGYNLKPILRSKVAAKRIQYKLRELSWAKHPELKRKQNIFVGRNDKLEEFEARIHDFDRTKPSVIISSGLPGVGRRTFLHRALVKTNLIEDSHRPSSIVLDRNVSIEDFILKLNDLGFLDLGNEVLSLTSTTIKDKIKLIHRLMHAIYNSKEVVFLIDDGCLVNYKRELSQWFLEAINSYPETSFPIFCIASKYKVSFNSRPRNFKYYFIELNELNMDERKRLLVRLLELYKVALDKQDFEDVLNLLFGLPDQVMFAVDLIREDNISSLPNKLPILTEYNSDKAAVLLRKYDESPEILEFIRLLAQFEVIASDFVFSIVAEKDFFPILEELASQHIVELIGVDGEIIRLNDIVRDYIKRNRIKLNDNYQSKIREQVTKLATDDEIFEHDSSEYIFSLKEMLKEGLDIDEKFLIPSHYLRCMKDLYYNKGNLDRIIELADLILQKRSFLGAEVLQDIRYYLCQALAKKKDERLLSEVQHIKGDEHDFLLGFYYRLQGRYVDALERFTKIIDAPYVSARAKREIVLVYVQLEEYDKALDFARSNFEENRGNQFHTQAYFNCLINSEDPENNREKLKMLIENLKRIDSEQSNEMAATAEALFYAKVENEKVRAVDMIRDCVNKFPENHYPLLAYCDIALRYRDKELLKWGIDKLEKMGRQNLSSRTLNRYRAFSMALDGREDEALRTLERELSRYPRDSRDRLIRRVKEYCLASVNG